jgi:acyl carrier protein
MSLDEARSKILPLLHKVAPEADLARLDPEENLREALDIDSFDFLKVVVAFHDTFGVTIPESDYSRITTLKGMTEYVVRNTK